MPHITIEVPTSIKDQVDWKDLFKKMHLQLSAAGYGRLNDFKSRIVILEQWQVADREDDAIFLFTTLETMNPRPPEMIRAMGFMIYEILENKAREIANGRWLQVCVRVGGTPAEDYFKSHINAPNLKSGNFKVGESS